MVKRVHVVSLLSAKLGSLSKLRRQREKERQQTNGLMSKIIALQMRFKFWFISWPFSTKNSVVEQGWRSGESARLPTMWPGFDSGPVPYVG